MESWTIETQNQISRPDFTKLLESKGIRATAHRLSIAEYVLKDHWHFTAEEIFNWAENNLTKVSRATVYNTLNEFVHAGILRSFQSSNSASAIFDSNVKPHFHLFDSETRRYVDIDSSMVELKSSLAEQFDIEHVEILIKGRRKA